MYDLDTRKRIAQSTPQDLIHIISPLVMATHLINSTKSHTSANQHNNNNNNNRFSSFNSNGKRRRELPADGIYDAYQQGACNRGTQCRFKHVNRGDHSGGATSLVMTDKKNMMDNKRPKE